MLHVSAERKDFGRGWTRINADKKALLSAFIRVHSRPKAILNSVMRSKILLAAALLGSAFAADVPRKAPEIGVQLPGGKQALVSSYRGKVLCLAFILTT